MKVYAKHGNHLFLVSTDGDPDTWEGSGVVVDTSAKTVQRVKQVQKLMRQGKWKAVRESDPTLDQLTARVPALRPFRGIEIRLTDGATAWIRWREWSSDNPAIQEWLTETTQTLSVPIDELDADYFLANQAAATLGGEVLDRSRTPEEPSDSVY